MLQETVYKRKRVGLLKRGFWYIETTRAIWDRVQIISRSRSYIKILYIEVARRGKRQSRRVIKELPIRTITTAREYL